jgi:hypothetical protein
MSYQGISTGTSPNDGTGDTLIDGAVKINSNFQEIYNALGDGSNINFNQFPSGTTLLFYQASAPTGWTKVTSHNNKALRVVSGTGGGSGGTTPFTSVFASNRSVPLPQHNHGASTGGAGSHSHSINDPGHRHTYERERIEDRNRDGGGATADNTTNTTFTSFSTTGISVNGVGNHSHSVSVNNAGTPGASMDFAVQYIDVIIAQRN